MGRRKKGSSQRSGNRKNFNRGGGKVGEGYDLGTRDNELFVKYYKGLGIVPEGEWDEFYSTLKKTLPVTFRITGYKSQSEELLNNITGKFFSNILDVKVDGEEVPPPKSLPWYPNNLAWQLDLTRKIVRSSEHLSRLHDFLVAETECGAISRQEAVSMIPPLVLDIKSHHKILDMCASPGSKTAQLIEYLHSTSPEGELPTGYVIANDTDNKRCYLMVHQVKRLQSPCCMIVNHDGTNFPKIRANNDDKSPEFHLFDRVLCDVPCSGDGTMRKNFDVWNKWHPLQGANLHGLQCKLLRRGCQLLEKNGRIVYSTCSLNPIEDEAVIADMLRSSEGAMELVDIHDLLPGLKFVKGLSTWKVMTKTGEWIHTPAEIPAPMQTQFKHTIFPPTAEEAQQFHLDRCMRILPHQQDTGGFFIAALQKVRHLPASREARLKQEAAQSSTVQETPEVSQEVDKQDNESSSLSTQTSGKRKGAETEDGPQSKKKKLHGYKEDPFLFMEESDPIWPSIRDFFGLAQDFPVNQILFRSLQGKRTLYYVSKAIRDITKYNDGRIKFINMGVKAFSRSPSPIVPQCDFRITQEVLGTLLGELTKRKVAVSKNDAIIAISQENPFISKLGDEAQKRLHDMSAGSTVFVFSPSEKEPTPACEVVFCGWRGKNSVRCFGSRSERSHALMLLGEDLKDINKRVEAERKQKQEARQHPEADSNNKTEDAAALEDEEGLPSVEDDEDKLCDDVEEDKKDVEENDMEIADSGKKVENACSMEDETPVIKDTCNTVEECPVKENECSNAGEHSVNGNACNNTDESPVIKKACNNVDECSVKEKECRKDCDKKEEDSTEAAIDVSKQS
ncbi:unnamed protein product [Candidula unifasciata]|uniref:tRNA (cytosine(34)-C(5))-methyltransferase n=1 Tax=Candidula unifasciata TaxID=100452 RepID=A0A8S4A479_9EUPU|nr:unnamed protein product [Candidula unifasciata]